MALNFANNNSLSAITTLPASISGGGMTLISEQTASSSATIDFTSNIDSTYDSYVFKFINIHASNDNVEFNVNFRDGGSSFDAVKTTTNFFAYHTENDSLASISYGSLFDLAQSTSGQNLSYGMGSGNDECLSGTLTLFNPSSTTFVKHFLHSGNRYVGSNISANDFVAGYGNTTSAVTGIQFKMSSGNIDSGVIKLYGIS